MNRMLLFGLVLMGVLIGECWKGAHAQSAAKYSEEETVLVMAQQCVAEIDFRSLEECWLMWHINLSLATSKAQRDPDWHLVDQIRAYNSAFRKKSDGSWLLDTPRTEWVRELNLQGTEPPHWPKDARSWDKVAPRWFETMLLARKFLMNPGRHPCPQANAYGGECYNNPKGACDKTPNCWIQVVCHKPSNTPFVQAYYTAKRCKA